MRPGRKARNEIAKPENGSAPMPFRIVRNDIIEMNTEAIVNTANDHPTVGTGCDYTQDMKNCLHTAESTWAL